MKPLTAKELEYIADSMSNEDLLIKQCVSAAAQTNNLQVMQFCKTMIGQHQQHYEALLSMLQQHTSIAPKTLEEASQLEQQAQQQAQAAKIQDQQQQQFMQ